MKTKVKKSSRTFEDIEWLNEVREVKHPLDSSHPIFVREVEILSGKSGPQPCIRHPERHPYCEFNINLEGLITQCIGPEKAERGNGDFMFLGPDTPHYAFRHSYPHRTMTIYFLPLVLFQMGPNRDGAVVLSRFTAPQTIQQRILSPPAEISQRIVQKIRALAEEWKVRAVGFELRLWVLLVDSLVDLIRWEAAEDRAISAQPPSQEWRHVEKALSYIHEHFAKPLYVEQIAEEVGITPNRLRAIFKQGLGTTCAHYIFILRIARAKALLCQPDVPITQVAYDAGFDALSHFNSSFRKQVGFSPSQFRRQNHLDNS